MPFIVELEPDLFLAPDHGDPGRTLVIHSAKLFRSIGSAKCGLAQAREYRPFLRAVILPVSVRLERI